VDIAHQNKREIYNLLMRASADTVIKIAADPKHLGARAGLISVLHTRGIGDDPSSSCPHDCSGRRFVCGWGKVDRQPQELFLSIRVLSRLYHRLILEGLIKLHKADKLQFSLIMWT
jgi:hypothetical protein